MRSACDTSTPTMRETRFVHRDTNQFAPGHSIAMQFVRDKGIVSQRTSRAQDGRNVRCSGIQRRVNFSEQAERAPGSTGTARTPAPWRSTPFAAGQQMDGRIAFLRAALRGRPGYRREFPHQSAPVCVPRRTASGTNAEFSLTLVVVSCSWARVSRSMRRMVHPPASAPPRPDRRRLRVEVEFALEACCNSSSGRVHGAELRDFAVSPRHRALQFCQVVPFPALGEPFSVDLERSELLLKLRARLTSVEFCRRRVQFFGSAPAPLKL